MIDPSEVGYINPHGTGTPLNDRAETAAIKTAFGEHAYRIAISSTKPLHGHLMGGAGALEAIAAVQAIRTGVVPPTINYEEPDPACDLNVVRETTAVSNGTLLNVNFTRFGQASTIVVQVDV